MSLIILQSNGRQVEKEGRTEIEKIEYLENENSFLVEIKSIFHSFWRTIIWRQNKNLMKMAETSFKFRKKTSMPGFYNSSPDLSVPPEQVSRSSWWLGIKPSKDKHSANGLIERTSSMLDEKESKTCTQRQKRFLGCILGSWTWCYRHKSLKCQIHFIILYLISPVFLGISHVFPGVSR